MGWPHRRAIVGMMRPEDLVDTSRPSIRLMAKLTFYENRAGSNSATNGAPCSKSEGARRTRGRLCITPGQRLELSKRYLGISPRAGRGRRFRSSLRIEDPTRTRAESSSRATCSPRAPAADSRSRRPMRPRRPAQSRTAVRPCEGRRRSAPRPRAADRASRWPQRESCNCPCRN